MIAIKVLIFLAAFGYLVYSAYRGIVRDPRSGDIAGVKIPHALWGLGVFTFTLFGILPAIGQIPAGHRGVVLYLGKVTGQVTDEGPFVVMPFVNSVERMDCQTYAEKWECAGATRDLQDVGTEVTLNYHTNPERVADVYQKLRRDYVQRVIVPALREGTKIATAQYDAEQLIQARPKVKAEIEQYVTATLARYGLVVDGIAITNFAFNPEFNKAIEAKQVAVQNALKARNDLEKVKMEAEQTITTAKAEAEAIRIKTAAITSQGGRDYVALKAIEKWDGSVPHYNGTGSFVPFLQLGGIK